MAAENAPAYPPSPPHRESSKEISFWAGPAQLYTGTSSGARRGSSDIHLRTCTVVKRKIGLSPSAKGSTVSILGQGPPTRND